jgi:hypothetical protein
MWILGNSTRPGPCHCEDLGSLPPATRAAHPRRELSERHFPADQARESLRLYLPAGAALAHHAHQEIAEAIVKPLDVREHAHARMVPSERGERPCSVQQTRLLYVCGSSRESADCGHASDGQSHHRAADEAHADL